MPVYPTFIIITAFALRSTYAIDLSLVVGFLLLQSWRSCTVDLARLAFLVIACVLLPKFEQWRNFYPVQVPRLLMHSGQLFEHWLSNRIASISAGELRAFLLAVLLGDKSKLSPNVQWAFGLLGIRHMLAVSGFHVGIWTALAAPLFHWFRRFWQKGLILAMLLGFLLIYTQSVGAGPSVIRAVGSFALARIAGVRLFQCSPMHWPMLMVIVAYFMNPAIGASLGFQLSYAAVFGILLALRRSPWAQFIQAYSLEKKPKAPAWLVTVQISLAAWTATLPIVQYHFGGASPYFLVGNLCIVPVYMFFIWTGLVAAFLGPILPQSVLVYWNNSFEIMNDWVLLQTQLLIH